MVKLKAPANASSASHGGKEYPVEEGHVEVPHEAVEALKAHGFELTTGAAAAPKKEELSDAEKAAVAFLKSAGDKVVEGLEAATFAKGDLELFKAMELKGKARKGVLEALDAALKKLEPPAV